MNQSLQDIKDDFAELLALAESCGARVWKFKTHFEQNPGEYREEARGFVGAHADALWNTCQDVAEGLRGHIAAADGWTADLAPELVRAKHEAADLLRALHANLGFVLSAGDWQSPTFLHSLQPQSGKYAGRIVGTENDYKRDWHHDAALYEVAFRASYIDSPLHLPPRVFLTSSGMAAFTTAVDHIRMRGGMRGPLLVGSGCYFENKILLERLFPGQITYADEFDADAFVTAAKRLSPCAVFVDSLCNTDTVAMPDLAKLLPALSRALPRRAALVLDNSGMATMFQPLRHLPRVFHPRLYVVESMNKFYQFGFDRVTGGVLWTAGVESIALMKSRVHLGTNMPDASALTLPWPDRAALDKRLARIGRNALDLARRLDAHASAHPGGALARVVYPGLPNYPGYAWTKDLPFHGAFLVLSFAPRHARVSSYQKFVAQVVDEARSRGVGIVSGTSFGMDVTRIYLTALHSNRLTKPFVRVSVGTETEDEIAALADVFAAVLDRT